jgi:hypothetical protein
MKKLNTETNTKGVNTAQVHDYKSGVKIGTANADWDQYRLWAEGPSDVCEVRHCLSETEIARLGIQSDTVVFLLD